MARLLRYFFSSLSALSLLLCVAASVLWVRGYGPQDRFRFQFWSVATPPTRVRTLNLGTGCSVLWLTYDSFRGDRPADPLKAAELARDARRYAAAQPVFVHTTRPPYRRYPSVSSPTDRPFWARLGFSWQEFHRPPDEPGGNSIDQYSMSLPSWLVVPIFAILPALWLRRRVRRQRRPGHCRACGYDVRATPGRCPECGTIVIPSPG